jgi:hypothetical protein
MAKDKKIEMEEEEVLEEEEAPEEEPTPEPEPEPKPESKLPRQCIDGKWVTVDN